MSVLVVYYVLVRLISIPPSRNYDLTTFHAQYKYSFIDVAVNFLRSSLLVDKISQFCSHIIQLPISHESTFLPFAVDIYFFIFE